MITPEAKLMGYKLFWSVFDTLFQNTRVDTNFLSHYLINYEKLSILFKINYESISTIEEFFGKIK